MKYNKIIRNFALMVVASKGGETMRVKVRSV